MFHYGSIFLIFCIEMFASFLDRVTSFSAPLWEVTLVEGVYRLIQPGFTLKSTIFADTETEFNTHSPHLVFLSPLLILIIIMLRSVAFFFVVNTEN